MPFKVLTKVSFVLTFFFVPSAFMALRAQTPAFANFECAQTNPIRLSADGTRLFAVNTPNASLSVFDVTTPGSPKLIAEIPVGVEPVSVNINPSNSDEAWVVNEESDSVSVVSVSRRIVTDTLYTKDEPMDVVFAGSSQAYVSCSRNNVIAVFNTSTHAAISQLAVLGDNPRALAVSKDGSTVYAAFALAGNGTTIIPSNLAPPQPPPTNPALPPPPQTGLIVAATNSTWSSYITFKMPDYGVVAIKTGASPSIAGYYSGIGTVNLGLAVNPITGDLFVANTDALNLTFYEPNLRGHWVNNRLTRIQVSTGQITSFDLNPNINYSILPNPVALTTALAQPAGVVFDPSGNFMYVAAFGTDRVAQVDTNGNVLSFVEVSPPSGSGSNVDPTTKRGPRGLALNATANTLYCLNRISNTISIINTSQKVVSNQIPVGTDPTPQAIKTGRGFLYDAKLSGSGTGACASCHVDGEMDKLAWNLGNPGGNMTSVVQNGQTIQFHPMKGPMTTQTLRGLLNQFPYHWRGDQPDFAAFNSTFDVLMGGNQLSDSAMTAYTNFVNTILYQPNPNQLLNRTFPSTFDGGDPTNGQSVFINVALTAVTAGPSTCNSCHEANPGTGTNRLIDAVDFNQPLKNPHLRNVYQRLLYNLSGPNSVDGFGLDHDGKVPGIAAFFHGSTFANYSDQQKDDMRAFLLCFDTGTAPAVGYTRTLTNLNVTSSSAQQDWTTLQQQAAAGNINLIARGTINGQLHGLLYQPASKNYITDTGTLGPFTQAQLQTLIQGGDILSLMGVYPGTGSAQVAPAP